jgi:glyoxylase-like metal-dependent hydrolase (beta-lactamase superfamily II)
MKRITGLLLAALALSAGPASAQQDAQSFLQAADRAIGASALNSVQITAAGWYAPMGQNFAPDEHWPRLNLQSYTLTIDYPSKSSKEEMVVTQGTNPSRGGGFQPIQGEQRTASFVSGNSAWTVNAQGQPVAQPAEAEARQFLIWTSPHGFIKAARAAKDATLVERYMNMTNRTIKVVGFTTMGKYRVTGEFNGDVLDRVITWIPDPVMGDMQYEIRYTDYRDIGSGVKFPHRFHAHRGDSFLLPTNFARNWMDYTVKEARANIQNASLTVPANVANAQPAPINVTATQLTPGVWLMGGGSHNSVAIEFRDFVTVIEAPLNDARSNAVIAEVHRRIPNKPIKYLVNTHHHFDHLGGVRSYVAEGATVVTHESNADFYNRVVFATQSRTLSPDRLSMFPFATTGPTPVRLETMRDRHFITDGQRTLMLFQVPAIQHASNMIVAYLPQEGILINGDLYTPPAAGAPPPANVGNGAIGLYNTVKRLNLTVNQHVPIHGQPGTQADFERIVGPAAAAAAAARPAAAGEGG